MLFNNGKRALRNQNLNLYREVDQLKQSISLLEAEKTNLEKFKKEISFIRKITESSYFIEGFKTNKIDEELYICVLDFGISFSIYLKGLSYSNLYPRLMVDTIKSDYSYLYDEEKIIYITDIQTEKIDVGNGSILMEYFIKKAKKRGFDKIDGYLSSVDKDHFDRSEYFYKKHKFNVEFNGSRTSGHIEKKLR